MNIIYLPKRSARTKNGRRMIDKLLRLGYFIQLGSRPSARFDAR